MKAPAIPAMAADATARPALYRRQVDAHHARRGLVGADRFHRPADARAGDEDEAGERHRERAENPDEARALGDAVEAERAAGVFPVEEQDAQHFAEADGRDGEIDAGQAQGRRADHECEQAGTAIDASSASGKGTPNFTVSSAEA